MGTYLHPFSGAATGRPQMWQGLSAGGFSNSEPQAGQNRWGGFSICLPHCGQVIRRFVPQCGQVRFAVISPCSIYGDWSWSSWRHWGLGHYS